MRDFRTDMRVNKIADAIGKKMISEHLGRWCVIEMKKDGHQFKIIRDGYGPMEKPENDKCHIVDVPTGETINECDNLYQVARYLIGLGY